MQLRAARAQLCWQTTETTSRRTARPFAASTTFRTSGTPPFRPTATGLQLAARRATPAASRSTPASWAPDVQGAPRPPVSAALRTWWKWVPTRAPCAGHCRRPPKRSKSDSRETPRAAAPRTGGWQTSRRATATCQVAAALAVHAHPWNQENPFFSFLLVATERPVSTGSWKRQSAPRKSRYCALSPQRGAGWRGSVRRRPRCSPRFLVCLLHARRTLASGPAPRARLRSATAAPPEERRPSCAAARL